jgi:hypothetical protein
MSKHPAPNKSVRSKFLHPLTIWVGVLTFCLVFGMFLSNRTELAEAYERVICGEACPSLTANELRLKAIKSYLHFKLKTRKKVSDGGGNHQLALLPVNLSALSLAQGIKDSTLLTTLTTGALLLQTREEIDLLEPSILRAYPSIAWYSLHHRTAEVIPTQSIQPIRLQDVDPSLKPLEAAARRIGRWERLRGYGEHFFQVTEYWDLNLSCCDGLGDFGGTSLDTRKKSSLDSIKSNRPWIFAVSDRGGILLWEITAASPGPTYILLATQPYRLLPHQHLPFKDHP